PALRDARSRALEVARARRRHRRDLRKLSCSGRTFRASLQVRGEDRARAPQGRSARNRARRETEEGVAMTARLEARTERGSSDPLTTAWLVLSSQRTTAVLVIALALFAALAALVPQGREALALARNEAASEIHRFAALGLTDVFESAWIRALGVL